MNTIFATNEKERAYVVQPGNIQNKGIPEILKAEGFLTSNFFSNCSLLIPQQFNVPQKLTGVSTFNIITIRIQKTSLVHPVHCSNNPSWNPTRHNKHYPEFYFYSTNGQK